MIAQDVAFAVQLDATNSAALESQNLKEVDVAVVSIGSSFQEMLLCVFQLKEIGVKKLLPVQGTCSAQNLEKWVLTRY